MRKTFLVLGILLVVGTFAMLGVNTGVKAGGTAPCNHVDIIDYPGGLITCSTEGLVLSLPTGYVATLTDLTSGELKLFPGPVTPGLHMVGAAANLEVVDKEGNPVTWMVPAIKICFPVFDGQVRRWVSPSELSGWYGHPVSEGAWEPLATVSEDGMTCGLSYELPGPFAVFQSDAH